MNILITGGAGYIGSVLVDYIMTYPWVLNETPYLSSVPDIHVRVLDNLMYKQDSMVHYSSLKYANFEFVYGDVRDENLLNKHVDWADVIIPLAAIVGMPACERDVEGAWSINSAHVQRIAISTQGTSKKVLYPNTNSGYGLGQGDQHCTEETPLVPISVYGKSKCAAEHRVLDCGGVAFRLATVFGVSPRMRLDLLVNDFVYKAVTDGYVVLFEKDFNRNYIHVRDVVRAFCHIIVNYNKYQGQVFNLGLSNANLTKWELCMKIKEQVPGFSVQVDEIRKDPDQRNYIVSNEKIEKTGWQPEVSLESGIAELIKAYKVVAPIARKFTNV